MAIFQYTDKGESGNSLRFFTPAEGKPHGSFDPATELFTYLEEEGDQIYDRRFPKTSGKLVQIRIDRHSLIMTLEEWRTLVEELEGRIQLGNYTTN